MIIKAIVRQPGRQVGKHVTVRYACPRCGHEQTVTAYNGNIPEVRCDNCSRHERVAPVRKWK